MKKKTLFLVASICALITFADYLFYQTENKDLFGISINIWVHRAIWLFISISFIGNYLKLRKEEKMEK